MCKVVDRNYEWFVVSDWRIKMCEVHQVKVLDVDCFEEVGLFFE